MLGNVEKGCGQMSLMDEKRQLELLPKVGLCQ